MPVQAQPGTPVVTRPDMAELQQLLQLTAHPLTGAERELAEMHGFTSSAKLSPPFCSFVLSDDEYEFPEHLTIELSCNSQLTVSPTLTFDWPAGAMFAERSYFKAWDVQVIWEVQADLRKRACFRAAP